MKMMLEGRLLAALRNGLPKLESLRWFVRLGDPVEELVAHFSKLPSFRSLELFFWNDKVFPDFPLDAISNLTKLELFFLNDKFGVKSDNPWVENTRTLFQRLQKVVEASPSLESLRLGKRFRNGTHGGSEFGYWPMFPSDLLLSPSAARNLRHLALCAFDLVESHAIPTSFYPTLFCHLTSLTSVDFVVSGSETEPAIWRALLDSNVLLTSIRTDYVNSNLISYISQPKIPLESLTLHLDRFVFEDDELGWEGFMVPVRRIYVDVLEVHRGRLRCLNVQASRQSFWWIECLNPSRSQAAPTPPAPAVELDGLEELESFETQETPVLLEETSLFRCQQLRSLGVVIDLQRALTVQGLSLIPGAVEKRVTAFLKQLCEHMPWLDTVTIHSPDRCAYGMYSDEARQRTREAIQDFIVTEKDRTDAYFDVIFEESRYKLRRGAECADDESENSAIQWRFVDINAESDEDVWEEEEDDEEEDEDDEGEDKDEEEDSEAAEEGREAFNVQARDELPNLF